MTLPRRQFLKVAAGAAALPAFTLAAGAQAYPTRHVNLIVMLPAGSAPDIIARLAAQWLSERLGQQFVVENRPGAGGNLATDAVANAAPDGYTLLIGNQGPMVVNPHLYQNMRSDPERALEPIDKTVADLEQNKTLLHSEPAESELAILARQQAFDTRYIYDYITKITLGWNPDCKAIQQLETQA
jgi:hypothetical protein